MHISFCNSNDKEYQKKLNSLLAPIFLDFKFWYDLDLWDENYESYSIIENGEMLSNICLYKTEIIFEGKVCQALSMGGVATKEGHTGKGYSRILMEHILKKYNNTPIYLSANEDVIDFYPKFGFKQIYEKLPVYNTLINNNLTPVRLTYNDPKVSHYIKTRMNFSHKMDCLNTYPINMFHIHAGYLKNCIYEIFELECLVIAHCNKETLHIMGIFSAHQIDFDKLSIYLPFQNITRIEFGFMPDNLNIDYVMEEYEADPIFIKNFKCDLGNFKFPELSET